MKVVNKRDDRWTHYIGRGTIFGNPIRIGHGVSRATAIAAFERFARKSPALLAAIDALPEDAILGCSCKPLPCHGDIIVKLWKERRKAS